MDEAWNRKDYTCEEFAALTGDRPAELINGEIYFLHSGETPNMMGGTSSAHQTAADSILAQLYLYLRGKKCRVKSAPFDVHLSEKGDPDGLVIVEPDVMVICDQERNKGSYYQGAPELVVEVLSPSTRQLDRVTKLNQYQRAGVPEYWIVDPEDKTVQVLTLKDGYYGISAYGENDKIRVHVLEDCEIDLSEVFSE